MRSHVLGPLSCHRGLCLNPPRTGRLTPSPDRVTAPIKAQFRLSHLPGIKSFLETEADSATHSHFLRTRQSSAPTFPCRTTWSSLPTSAIGRASLQNCRFQPQAHDLDVAGLVQQALVGRGAWGLRCQLLAVTEYSPLV